MKKPITLNDIDYIIQAVDDVVRIWGTWNPQIDGFYSDIQFTLLTHFENMESEGKVNQVLNSWCDEIEDWEEGD